MKKFYSLLLLPLMSVCLFFGCGKVTRTVDEIKTLLTTTADAYEETITLETTTKNNWYFEKFNTGDVTKEYFRVVYDNAQQLNSIVYNAEFTTELEISETLNLKYRQLSTIYQRTLRMAYNYFSNWSEVFFEGITTKKPDSKDLTNLYDKMKAFQRELEDFHTQKQNLEREVKLFGLDSEIISSSIDKFNYNYTKLIGATLNFVNYFKDLHVKYFYNNIIVIDESYAQRIYDDGVLEIANYIYYDYLQALTKHATVQTYFVNDENNIYDIFNSTNSVLSQIAPGVTLDSGIKQLKTSFLGSVTNPDGSENKEKVEIVKQYEVSLNTFKQYFKLYKKVFSSVSMEGFNNYRFKTHGGYGVKNNLEDYLSKLNTVDAANARVLLDFEENKIYAFLNSTLTYTNVN